MGSPVQHLRPVSFDFLRRLRRRHGRRVRPAPASWRDGCPRSTPDQGRAARVVVRAWGMPGVRSRGQQGTTAVPNGQLRSGLDQRRRPGAGAFARAYRVWHARVRGSNPSAPTHHRSAGQHHCSAIPSQSAGSASVGWGRERLERHAWILVNSGRPPTLGTTAADLLEDLDEHLNAGGSAWSSWS